MIERSSNHAVKVERKSASKSEPKSELKAGHIPSRAPGTPPPFPPELAAQLSGAKAKIIAQHSLQPQTQPSIQPKVQAHARPHADTQPIELQPLHTGADVTQIDALVSAHLSANTRASKRPPPGPRISPLTAGIVTMLGAIMMAGGAGVLLTSKIKATRSSQQPEAIAKAQAEKTARAQAAAIRITAQSAATAPAQAAVITQAAPPTQAAPGSAAIPPSPLFASIAQDTIHSRAMAPTRGHHVPAAQGTKLFVQARDGIRSLDLRDGPGLEHKSLGKGAVEYEYPVVEWKGRWFKIGLDDDAHKTAWVHYDKIEILSDEDSSQ